MSEIHTEGRVRPMGGKPILLWLARVICLGAAPAFAVMALMYALMAVFHSAPWLRLAAKW